MLLTFVSFEYSCKPKSRRECQSLIGVLQERVQKNFATFLGKLLFFHKVAGCRLEALGCNFIKKGALAQEFS